MKANFAFIFSFLAQNGLHTRVTLCWPQFDGTCHMTRSANHRRHYTDYIEGGGGYEKPKYTPYHTSANVLIEICTSSA